MQLIHSLEVNFYKQQHTIFLCRHIYSNMRQISRACFITARVLIKGNLLCHLTTILTLTFTTRSCFPFLTSVYSRAPGNGYRRLSNDAGPLESSCTYRQRCYCLAGMVRCDQKHTQAHALSPPWQPCFSGVRARTTQIGIIMVLYKSAE